MRNPRLTRALYDDRNNFLIFISADAAKLLVQRGTARDYSPAKPATDWRSQCARHNRRGSVSPHMVAVALLPPPPPPSDSKNSNTTLTLSDMLANVELAVRVGGYISRERIEAARDKIAEFRVPSWVNLICVMSLERLENLPAFVSPLTEIDRRLTLELAMDDISVTSDGYETDFS